MDKLTKKEENTQSLLRLWFSKKYWSSCCEDEAIDWSQHVDKLNLKELTEFLEWRDNVLTAARTLSKYISIRDFNKIAELL